VAAHVTRASGGPAILCVLRSAFIPFATGVGLLLLLGGCSGPALQERAEGWRGANVVALGVAADLAPRVDHDCALGAAPNAPYLVLRYRDHGTQTWTLGTSEVQAGSDFQAGEPVQVNILDCSVRLPS
jgi:hypothetical protein